MRHHILKTWPGPFAAVSAHDKKHEIRFNDRGYAAGDFVTLVEWDPTRINGLAPRGETGKSLEFKIGYVSEGGTWGLPPDLCVFSLIEVGP